MRKCLTIIGSWQHEEKEKEKAYIQTIDILRHVVESRDKETKGHSERVASLAKELAEEMQLSPEDVETIHIAGLFHDIGKTRELSLFPENDYTDDGQLLGHIVMGTEMVGEHICKIPGFPAKTAAELKHCILAHHGEYEYGSPKKPAIIEAVALNFADNTDAKLQTFTEIMENTTELGWLGFNRLFDSNLHGTRME